MLYLWIKTLHIISSTILFGTGIGIASNLLYAHRTRDKYFIATTLKYVVLADWVFTCTSAIIQFLTGMALVYLAGYSFKTLWVGGALVGYTIAALCWFPVVYLQIKMRDMATIACECRTDLPSRYYQYFKYWFVLGWPAFASLLIVFYLMTIKPS